MQSNRFFLIDRPMHRFKLKVRGAYARKAQAARNRIFHFFRTAPSRRDANKGERGVEGRGRGRADGGRKGGGRRGRGQSRRSNQEKDSSETICPSLPPAAPPVPFPFPVVQFLPDLAVSIPRLARPDLSAAPTSGTRCNRTWRRCDWHLRVPRLDIVRRSCARRPRARTEKRLIGCVTTQRKPISTRYESNFA